MAGTAAALTTRATHACTSKIVYSVLPAASQGDACSLRWGRFRAARTQSSAPVTAVEHKKVRQPVIITMEALPYLGTQDSSLWPQRPLVQRCWLCRAQICSPAAGQPPRPWETCARGNRSAAAKCRDRPSPRCHVQQKLQRNLCWKADIAIAVAHLLLQLLRVGLLAHCDIVLACTLEQPHQTRSLSGVPPESSLCCAFQCSLHATSEELGVLLPARSAASTNWLA